MSRRYQLSPVVLNRIWLERLNQRALFAGGKLSCAVESPTVSNDAKLRVVTEELGEVAKEIDALELLTRERREMPHTFKLRRARVQNRLHNELTQLAAVTMAWLEALEVEVK